LAILNNSLDFVINNNNNIVIADATAGATRHAIRADKQSGIRGWEA